MRLLKSSLSLTALAVALSFPVLAHAQDATQQPALTTDQRIDALQAELDTLKRQRDLDQELAASAAAKNPVATVDKKGAKFVSADGKYEFDLNVQVNVDAHSFGNDGGTLRDEVQDRLIRPTFTARAGNALVKVTPEWGGTSSAASSILDAYVEYKVSDPIQFRAGKFKSPLGLERLQADGDVIWTERGHSTNLVPNRDVGYQLFGTVPGLLEYQVGLFDGAADNVNFNNDTDNHKDIAYRVFATPFGESDIAWLQGLGIGYAGSDGKHLGTTAATQLPTYKTPGQQNFFTYATGVFSNGKETRSNPQAYFYFSNFGLLADYVEVRQDVKLGTNAARLKHSALDVSGSWVITGESVGFKGGVKPNHDFNVDGSGLGVSSWGAFELTARYGYTDVDDATFTGGFASLATSASKATSTGVGLTWYLSENLKLVADWDHTKFVRGATTGDRPAEDFASGRVQFRY
jgi:phosphate-selective porin OprO/OprP